MEIKKRLVSTAIMEKVTYGKGNTKKYITIHETDNPKKGADADAHARSQANGNSPNASWHWQVDDKEAIQSFEHNVRCWAAGDKKGSGNYESIHIEICVNEDGNYQKAFENAIELTKKIMKDEKIPVANVVQHNKWSGKNCPSIMRKLGLWDDFVEGLKEPAYTPKPPNPHRKVQLAVVKVDKLNVRSKASWADSAIEKQVYKGEAFEILEKVKVDDAYMFRCKYFYITASSKYVEVKTI